MRTDSDPTKGTPVVEELPLGRLDDIQRRIFEARQRQAETMAWLIERAAHAVMGAVAAWIVKPVAAAQRRARLSRELSALDDHMLADIGLTRSDIGSVVNRTYEGRARPGAEVRPFIGAPSVEVPATDHRHPLAA
jgi:uncharacterized protein YjiS (DUF1127 family)